MCVVEAQSGLSQGSDRGAVAGARNTELGCRHWQRHWRLSRAGHKSGSGSDGCWKAQGMVAVVTVGGGRDAGRRRASLGGRM